MCHITAPDRRAQQPASQPARERDSAVPIRIFYFGVFDLESRISRSICGVVLLVLVDVHTAAVYSPSLYRRRRAGMST